MPLTPEYPAPISQGIIDEIEPIVITPPEKNTFEIAIALGGTISAGAYTAGVLDFLLEALEAWDAQKKADPASCPQHNVIIRAVTGASGGGITAILLGRILPFAIPHGPVQDNPLFSAWTSITMEALLKPEADQSDFTALLNTEAIAQMAKTMVQWQGKTKIVARPYFSDQTKIFVTLGNISSTPYVIDMRQGGYFHSMHSMSDWIRFSAEIPGGSPDNNRKWGPNEFGLTSGATKNWDIAEATCLATSAFPIAFKARGITRPLAFAGYRFVCISGDGKTPTRVIQLLPDWVSLAHPPSPDFSALCVDGGTVNNEPIDLAHRALAGHTGKNSRDKNSANRALLLIDPFLDTAKVKEPTQGILSVAMRLISGLISQARFKPEDIALAYDSDVYSRFLIAPTSRDRKKFGSEAIASGCLGGFGGFLKKEFMTHDFILGRYNAYVFLRDHFTLGGDNPIFDDLKPTGDLPIIPLVDAITKNPPLPPSFPQITDSELKIIFKQIEKRRDWLFNSLKSTPLFPKSGLWRMAHSAYFWIGWQVAKSKIQKAIEDDIKSSLTKWGLY